MADILSAQQQIDNAAKSVPGAPSGAPPEPPPPSPVTPSFGTIDSKPTPSTTDATHTEKNTTPQSTVIPHVETTLPTSAPINPRIAIQEQPTETQNIPGFINPNTPPPKNKSKVGILIAGLLLLLVTIPVAVYYVSQSQQLADSRSRASTGPYPGVATSTPSIPPGGDSCRYVVGGGTVSVAGDCSGYTFRALVFQCNGSASLGNQGRCEDKGIHPGFESIVSDNTVAGNGASVSIGGIPNCKSRQADLTVVGRPADGLSGDELPGTPRVENFVIQDGSCSSLPSDTPNPTITTTPQQCQSLLVYNTDGSDITAAIKDGSHKLSVGDHIILATPKGQATNAHFRIQGLTDYQDHDPAISTATEYRLNVQIPATVTQAQGNFELEIFIDGAWK
jgi:hypothetical protein